MRLEIPGYQTRSLIFSDPRTIKAACQAHKPADSGVVVGNDARRCSLAEVTAGCFKRTCLSAQSLEEISFQM